VFELRAAEESESQCHTHMHTSRILTSATLSAAGIIAVSDPSTTLWHSDEQRAAGNDWYNVLLLPSRLHQQTRTEAAMCSRAGDLKNPRVAALLLAITRCLCTNFCKKTTPYAPAQHTQASTKLSACHLHLATTAQSNLPATHKP
jgi:hypothetical protein